MRISKTKVFDFLTSCQIEKGRYKGNLSRIKAEESLSYQALLIVVCNMEGKSFHCEILSTIKVLGSILCVTSNFGILFFALSRLQIPDTFIIMSYSFEP